MNHPELHQKTFMFLLVAVSLAFGWVLLPFYSAVLWSGILALLFAPLYRRLLALLGRRRNLAAFVTLVISLVAVILPMIWLIASLLQEGDMIYRRIAAGQLDMGTLFRQAMDWLPPWIVGMLGYFGITDLAALQGKISAGAGEASQYFAAKAVSIGQNAFDILIGFGIMLYLLFFLLRDGSLLAVRIGQVIPLSAESKRNLFAKFTATIRATIKGSLIVSAVQGGLGGLIFAAIGVHEAVLLGFFMAVLSLLPAVGTPMVWIPAAIYFVLTGSTWKAVVVIVVNAIVLVVTDSVLRPLLVGKDTQMPDYLVLVSTLGGLAIFGLNGFVIGPVIAALFIAAWDIFSSMEPSGK